MAFPARNTASHLVDLDKMTALAFLKEGINPGDTFAVHTLRTNGHMVSDEEFASRGVVLAWEHLDTTVAYDPHASEWRVSFACDDDECEQPHTITFPENQQARVVQFIVAAAVSIDGHYLFH